MSTHLKKLSQIIGGSTLVAMLASVPAFAQPASESTAKAKSTLETLQDRMNLTYNMSFYGPSVASPLNPKQPSEAGIDQGGQIDVRNIISAAYVFENGWNLGPTVDFDVYVSTPQTVSARNPSLRLNMPSLLKAETRIGTLTYNQDARMFFGLSNTSRQQNRLGSLASNHVISMQWGKSIFSSSLRGYAQYNQFLNGGNGKGDQINYFTILGSNAQLNDKIGLWASLEFDGKFARGFGGGMHTDGTYVDIGASWTPIAQLEVSPSIDIKTQGKNLIDSTQMNLSVTFILL